ncbi:aldehyde oxidase [Tepiditoga spiralis]|uniref:Aldehyde oxidase n=1 Tax=Tepiditoga spiralis TaxID=2108365 RepID=A0A7G1G2N5_9BACT|nr:molybdopterin cofactor-binding domain-containing protein [Tepiditoga spiralis]BBE30611.1 aldehyde oxidase [Tepiditoga spiralis]
MKEVKKSIPKVDGVGLLMGKPAYTNDLAPQDALIVKILRSPHPFAKIISINTDEALSIEGVECILTHKDFPKKIFTRAGQGYPEPSPYDKFVLDEYVRYVGDEVAAVAAINEEVAEKALKKIKVEYELFEPVLDFKKAKDSKIIHFEKEAHSMFEIGFNPERNIAASYNMNVGNVEEELKKCDVVVESKYYTQPQAHVMLEPMVATSFIDYMGRLNVITATQVPFHIRRILSNVLNLSINKIRVIKPRIGGGFGGKQAIHGEPYVAMVTLKTGKPAKIIYTRKEVFEATYSRHEMEFNIKIGADKDGLIKAIDVDVLSNTGAYGEHALTVFMVAGSKTLPLYNKVNAVRFGGDVVYTNLTPAGAYRGYGAIQGNFALESVIDELAEKLKISPVEIRTKNMIKEGETSPIFKIMGEGREGVEMNIQSCKLDYCVKRGMELIKWNEKYPKKAYGNKIRSVGMAIAMQGSGIADIDMGSAILKLNDDGSFNLLVGATDLGTGSDTILSQIAAETLGVSTDKIIPYSSDTDLTPFDTGAYASSTTYVSGNSVRIAAENMKKMILEEGSKNLGTDKVHFNGEEIIRDDNKNKISLKQLSELLYYSMNQKQLVADGSYVGKKSPPPYMASFVEIELDTETGKVEVINFVSVVDCGTPINPNLAKVQVEGALVQGIGMTLYEDINFSNGKMRNNTLMTYRIPDRRDVKKLTVEFAESYEPSGPYGAKSVGEIGIDTPPAAIANAIFNATGVRIRSLPITPEKVFKAMEMKK